MEEMKEYIKNYEEVSLCSREFDLIKVDKIKRSFNKPIVYISVGRSIDLKEEMDVSNLDYDFIVTKGVNLKGNNVYYLGKETSNTQDYIIASDYIITKAGWGTISEALLAKKKIVVLERNNVSEDRNTISRLKNMNLAIEVSYNTDFDLEKTLNKLKNFKPRYNKYKLTNSYKEVAIKIINKLINVGD